MEPFQASANGPKGPLLHSQIQRGQLSESSTPLPTSDLGRLTKSDIAVINEVVDYYGNLSEEDLAKRLQSELQQIVAHQRARSGD